MNKNFSIKSLFFVLSLFLFNNNCFSQEITIASWNINKHHDQDAIECIAEFAKNENLDIICLQEVRLESKGSSALYEYIKILDEEKSKILVGLKKSLKDKTKKNWTYLTCAKYAIRKDFEEWISCDASQNNIIFYNSDVLEAEDLISDFGLNRFEKAKEKYRMDKNNVQIVSFVIRKNNKKINVVNVHLPFNERCVGSESTSVFWWKKSDSKYGTNICRDLHALWEIYDNLNEYNTIICGDFNMSAEKFELKNQISKTHFTKNDFHVTEETTLNKKDGFSSSYDHFVYSTAKKFTVKSDPQRAAKIENTQLILGVGNNKQRFELSDYRINISDHVPIIMTIIP